MSIEFFDNFKNSKDYVQSLDRGLQVLQSFTTENQLLSVSEVASITGLSRPTARRILLTLEYLGFVFANHGKYALTPKIVTLSNAYLSAQSSSWQFAIPFMQNFANTTGESSSISILDGDKIIYVARVSKKRIMSINLDIGSQLPAFATSMGQVLLAHLPEGELREILKDLNLVKFTENTVESKEELITILKDVQEKGWAGVDQQFENGLRSIAVPIINQQGKVVAAINCSVHAGRVSTEELRNNFLPLLKETSRKIGDLCPIRSY
ncbi:IclR family transcriptional regulator domain-containing protein [Ureibacillus aquaedulcis]|uniref:IclR family transcriptional regulator C-terminal domain-containing protein n=1 Tax=Ureibacillus aquaedulcis TaxID=3058421 RepID=A0ABT8GMQ7_9BACL|nr:IclR family transcriptional regulator C-terminal domain-containing protein [Ureibacillus sp. BA0131]MDN4492687.1 IclR family transcriptional regulator C-terminal domain-containing protein [Ureibacillus sp. BA0131]